MDSKLYRFENSFIRILKEDKEDILIIDCVKQTMPKWADNNLLSDYHICKESDLKEFLKVYFPEEISITENSKRIMHKRFTIISHLIPFIDDIALRTDLIKRIAKENNISVQSIRRYLCLYLSFLDIRALAPTQLSRQKTLSDNEKNIRWALNKFYYNKQKNSLKTAYEMMLKNKYCDGLGMLNSSYPSFTQFTYFYRKHRKLQTQYISRNGLKYYQRNQRPLVGNGVQTFAPTIGTYMIDSTICDIFLINDKGDLIGRPILTASIDAYSQLCSGYFLSWEGGVYSLRGLIKNITTDKVKWCHKFGIHINHEDWNCTELPGVFVTDKGKEYQSATFEQLSELGIQITNLSAYRPELKGIVEKFFDILQNLFKPQLKGKGIVESDYKERGGIDYRKQACLTMDDFEKIIIRCIIYYNSKRIIKNFPCTRKMIDDNLQPYASAIWNWELNHFGGNLIKPDDRLPLVLLPRTKGKFERFGLKVNKMHYYCEGFTEEFLNGGECIVAYDADDVSWVWLYDCGKYTRFQLIESRYANLSLNDVYDIQKRQRSNTNKYNEESLQAKLNLIQHISVLSESGQRDIDTHDVRMARQLEKHHQHLICQNEAKQ